MPVSQAVLRRVGQRIAAHAGLHPPDWVLAARIEQRIAALALERPDSYAQILDSASGRSELDQLIESLRVGETRFFRHQAHVRAVTNTVIPALTERPPGSKVRAWSAGCATGEEAYTLALLLARHLKPPTYKVSVLGSDISRDALQIARTAVYPQPAVKQVPASLRSWAFEPDQGARYRVGEHIRKLVSFEQRNLAEQSFPGAMDLIFCRNVLIYFTTDARHRVVERLIASLSPGGFLFVGYSESLRDYDQLEAIRAPDCVVYRKPPAASSTATPASDSHSAGSNDSRTTLSAPPPAAVTPSVAATSDQGVLCLSGRYDHGDRLARELGDLLSAGHRQVTVDLDGADYLDDEAGAVLRRAMSAARAAGIDMRLRAERQSTQRWLSRARVGGGAR